MKNGVNENVIVIVLVENGVRKAPEQRTPKIFEDFTMKLRITADGQDASFQATQELFPQTGFAVFIPVVSFGCILLGFGKNGVVFKHVAGGFFV